MILIKTVDNNHSPSDNTALVPLCCSGFIDRDKECHVPLHSYAIYEMVQKLIFPL